MTRLRGIDRNIAHLASATSTELRYGRVGSSLDELLQTDEHLLLERYSKTAFREKPTLRIISYASNLNLDSKFSQSIETNLSQLNPQVPEICSKFLVGTFSTLHPYMSLPIAILPINQ